MHVCVLQSDAGLQEQPDLCSVTEPAPSHSRAHEPNSRYDTSHVTMPVITSVSLNYLILVAGTHFQCHV